MKILIYNWRDIKNPEAGGAEVFTHENAKRWVKAGNEVIQFSASFPRAMNEETVDGVRIVRDGNRITVYSKAREYYKKYFSKEKFDIVIDEINTIPFFTPDFVKEKKVALIHQLAREFWFHETPFPAALLGRYFLENRWLSKYRNIPTMAVSNSTKQDLINLGFTNVSIVPEGIRFKPLKKVPRKENKTLIFVGRLKKAKKPQDAIKAFSIVRKKIPSAKLWIAGSGYYRDKLEKIAGKNVRFFGKVSEKRKLELMRKANAILVPGIREGWGLIVTEANACGTPAIAYNVPGLRDSVEDGNNGLLVSPNPKNMAEAIIRFLSDKNLQEMLSENALTHSRQFSWDNSAKETLNFLEKVVNG